MENSLFRGTLVGAMLGGSAGAATTRNKIHASGGAARGAIAGIICSAALSADWFNEGTDVKGRQAIRGALAGGAVFAGLASIVGPRLAPVSPLTIGIEAGVAGAILGAGVDALLF